MSGFANLGAVIDTYVDREHVVLYFSLSCDLFSNGNTVSNCCGIVCMQHVARTTCVGP